MTLALCLTPAFLHLACLPMQAQSSCQGSEARHVLDDINQAEDFSKAQGTIARERKGLTDARDLLNQLHCDKGALGFAEQAVALVYIDSDEAAVGAQHIVAACEFSEQMVPNSQRWEIEFNCKSVLLPLLIELDRFDEAKQLAQKLHEFAGVHGLDTLALVAELTGNEVKSMSGSKDARAEAYQQAIDTLAQGAARTELDICKLTNAASTHLFLGEYGAALAKAKEAHRLLETEPDSKRSICALGALRVRGSILLYLGDPREAMKAFEEGESLVSGVLNEVSGNPQALMAANYSVALFYGKMTVAQLLLKETEEAQKTVEKALHAAQASKFEGLATFLGLDRLRAQVEVSRQSGLKADQLRKAQDIMIAADDVTGEWLLKLRDTLTPAQVSSLIKQSPQLLALASREDRIQLYTGLARALQRNGDSKAAIQNYVAAITLIEAGRFEAKETEALPIFFSSYVSIYDAMIAALYMDAKHDNNPVDPGLLQFGSTYPEIALYFSEAAHARQFSERYGPALLDSFAIRTNLPDSVRKRELELRQQAGSVVDPAFGPSEIHFDPFASRQRAEQATKAYLDFLESLTSQYPEFARLAFPRPVSVGSLPKGLDGQFIVLYKVTDESLYWWVILNNKVEAFGTNNIGREQLTAAVAQFLAYRNDKTVADPLSAAVVSEPFKQIENLSAIRPGAPPRVIIVPDEALYMLPWEALSAPRGGYVADAFITSYAPSLTVLAQTAGDAGLPVSDKAALVVGNTQEASVTIPILPPRPGVFPPLGRDEMQRVILTLRSQGYNVFSLEHAHATPEYLFALDATPYVLLHFDTHAFADTLEPPPSLILHPSSRSPYGLLMLGDVLKLKLRAQLVTLSACQSNLGGFGGALPGEGVESLARMFMLAGSKSVLASLWETDPAATTALMERFYEQLDASGFDEALALFRARAAVRRAGFASPSQWAPFILVGQPTGKLISKSLQRK